jgi:hypothetical protein
MASGGEDKVEGRPKTASSSWELPDLIAELGAAFQLVEPVDVAVRPGGPAGAADRKTPRRAMREPACKVIDLARLPVFLSCASTICGTCVSLLLSLSVLRAW